MMRYAVVSSGLGNTIVDTAPTTLRGVIALTAGTAAFTIYDDTADPQRDKSSMPVLLRLLWVFCLAGLIFPV